MDTAHRTPHAADRRRLARTNHKQAKATKEAKATKRDKANKRDKARTELQALAKQAAAAARMLKLIGNERRLLILCFLVANGEMRAGDLASIAGLSQSALSQHLAKMRADGLIAFRRQSQTLYYRISDERAALILKALKDIYCGDMARTKPRRR
jgi:DNA-binding transcriptional ArsR family regulator